MSLVRKDARGGIRTHDLRLRRPTLYPAELRARDVHLRTAPRSPHAQTYTRSSGTPTPDDEAPRVSRAYAGGFRQSGRLDLNQRPPAPEACALPGYATPRRYELGQHNAPGETRTPNLLIRSQMLYPIELRALRQVRQLAEAGWRLPSAHAGCVRPQRDDTTRPMNVRQGRRGVARS